MVAFRFVHTADWHLGQPYRSVPDLAERLREARWVAVEAILKKAEQLPPHIVLAAGDQFDSPTPNPALVERLLETVAAHPSVTVYMIPGNHDPLRPRSVYVSPAFGKRPPNLIVLDRPEPVALDGSRVTLYPCPCTAQWGDNPLTWIPRRQPGQQLRIALAHGSLPSACQSDQRSYPIDINAPSRYDLDYVALGDWHRPTPPPAEDAAARMYYPGAPEIGGWDEPDAGQALVVELEPGALPRVAAFRTGQYTWRTLDADLADDSDLDQLLAQVKSSASQTTLLRLRLTGCLGAVARDRLEQALDQYAAQFARLEPNLDALACRSDDSALETTDPRLHHVFQALTRLADDPSALPANWPKDLPRPDAATIARALSFARRHLS